MSTTIGNRLILTDKEFKSYNTFCSEHCGRIDLIISFGGIGSSVEARCCGCGKTLDITDYGVW